MPNYADNGRFAASLEELSRAGGQYVGADLATGEVSGYRFTISSAEGGYVIHANPVTFGVTGRRCLYSDQTMVIRENKGPAPATADSPLFKR
jgi:hypothetical protein